MSSCFSFQGCNMNDEIATELVKELKDIKITLEILIDTIRSS